MESQIQDNLILIKAFNSDHFWTDDVFERTHGLPAEFWVFRSSKSYSEARLTKHKTAFGVFIL